jgi:hypothetical protein
MFNTQCWDIISVNQAASAQPQEALIDEVLTILHNEI